MLGRWLSSHVGVRCDERLLLRTPRRRGRRGVEGQQQHLLGERRVSVNSLHAQGVDTLAPRALHFDLGGVVPLVASVFTSSRRALQAAAK